MRLNFCNKKIFSLSDTGSDSKFIVREYACITKHVQEEEGSVSRWNQNVSVWPSCMVLLQSF